MRIGFDLDGTLDKPALALLAKALLAAGHEVHVITGTFSEAGAWQDSDSKMDKMRRLGLPFRMFPYTSPPLPRSQPMCTLHVLTAADEKFDRDYRLADIGLRKGALCEKLGIEVYIDDSETYCKMVPAMAGGTVVLHVR